MNTQLYKDIQILVLTSPSNAEAGAAARELMACEFFCSKVKILSSTFSRNVQGVSLSHPTVTAFSITAFSALRFKRSTLWSAYFKRPPSMFVFINPLEFLRQQMGLNTGSVYRFTNFHQCTRSYGPNLPKSKLNRLYHHSS